MLIYKITSLINETTLIIWIWMLYFISLQTIENKYSPITKYKFEKNGPDMKPRYSYAVDAYLEVGFRYMQVSQAELKVIEEWQEENGLQQKCFDNHDDTIGQGNPYHGDGEDFGT